MRVTLVGADFEENLALGLLAAAAESGGHEVHVVPFNVAGEAPAIADAIARDEPDVVGLSVQFQHRAHDFLSLARRLRAAGVRAHVTCGGQFPTLAWREVLSGGHGVDTVVLHEGEQTFVELLDALETGRHPGDVAGLALLADDGAPVRSAPRRLVEDLDVLPFPVRYRPHSRHHGVPFVPLMGGRGCWGRCAYCSITSFYRDAREQGGGKMLRTRSAENIAEEMARIGHEAGEPCIFCFHDDNFLLPQPEQTLARVRAIRRGLDARGIGKAAIVGKCRPDTLTTELAHELRALGVIRLYVGVENASDPGAAHLRRGTQQDAIDAALEACREAGIFACYNLLVFEPEATIADVRENVAFIRAHSGHPVNFCRAEPYYGTPLHLELSTRQDLGGSYLGWNYRMSDDRAELLFRICASAFRERNFAPGGVANRYMGLGYAANILEYFHDDPEGKRAPLAREARDLTRAISLDTADLLERAADLAETLDPNDPDRVARETVRLGLEVAAADREWHAELDGLFGRVAALVAEARAGRRRPFAPDLLKVARNVALGASIALVGCDDDAVDPVPPDSGMDSTVVDPPPPDSSVDAADPLPEDAGVDAADAAPDAAPDATVVDPPPPDGSVVDPAPVDAGMDGSAALGPVQRGPDFIDKWIDSSPRRADRSHDLPLWQLPDVRLHAAREGADLRVELRGGPDGASTRWEADGELEGDGRHVRWTPLTGEDQVRVAIRSTGGVAIVSLRAKEVDPSAA